MSYSLNLIKTRSLGLSIVGAVACVLFMASCATAPIPRNALIDQILRPRPGHKPFLTNQIKKEDGSFEVMKYDLEVDETRKILNDLKFICKFVGKRYYICPDSPGICRNSFRKKSGGLFHKDKYIKDVETILFESNYDILVSGKLVCFSQESYPWDLF